MLHSIHSPKHLKQQQGTVVLLTAVVLALIMGILALTAARTSLMEQKITGNDIRAREAREAAEAGLEFAMAWAGTQPITAALTCPGGTGCPTIPTITASTSGATYSSTVVFTPGSNANYIKVVATATGTDGSTAKAESWLRQVSLFEDNDTFPPPFVINGGLSNVTGNPSINTGSPPGTAILTSTLPTAIDTGNFNKKAGDPVLGGINQASFTNAWNYVFKDSLSSAIQTAKNNNYRKSTNSTLPTIPADGKKPYYYWDSDSHIQDNFGSSDKSVVIIVGNGYCPKINGGPTIHGIVYFPSTCSDQGWGNATIYGSIISEGSITKVTANANHVGMGNSGGGGGTNVLLDYATTIPGTWKDF